MSSIDYMPDLNKPEMQEKVFDVLSRQYTKEVVDYDLLNEHILINNNLTESYYDLNFIVPLRGREDFVSSLWNCFWSANTYTKLNCSFTIVEHDLAPHQLNYFKDKECNYIFIPTNGPFNKSLSYNIGAINSPKCNHYMFHDIDILFKKEYFEKLIPYLDKFKAIQPYRNKRVLLCDKNLTRYLNYNNNLIEIVNEWFPGVSEASTGSTGGSIIIEKELFETIGMYDPELFEEYAPEDSFIWEKIKSYDSIYHVDDIELYHLHHEKNIRNSDEEFAMRYYHLGFYNLDKDKKIDLIKYKRSLYE